MDIYKIIEDPDQVKNLRSEMGYLCVRQECVVRVSLRGRNSALEPS